MNEKTYNPFKFLQIKIGEYCKQTGIKREDWKSQFLPKFKVKSTKELNQKQIFQLIRELQIFPQTIL